MKKGISETGASTARKPGHRRPSPTRAAAPPAIYPAILIEIRALLLKIVSNLKPLPVQTPDAVVFLKIQNLAVVTSTESRNLALHDLAGNVWTRFDTLAELEKRLDPDPRFFRCHKSFLVNLYAVRSLERTRDKDGSVLLTFEGDVKIKAKVSEANLKPLQEALGL